MNEQTKLANPPTKQDLLESLSAGMISSLQKLDELIEEVHRKCPSINDRQSIQVLRIITLLQGTEPVGLREIQAATSCSESFAYKWLGLLRATGFLYVAEWVDNLRGAVGAKYLWKKYEEDVDVPQPPRKLKEKVRTGRLTVSGPRELISFKSRTLTGKTVTETPTGRVYTYD